MVVMAPVRIPSSIPSAIVRVIPRVVPSPVTSPVPRVVPSSVEASVVIRIVPASVVPSVIPSAISPRSEIPAVPRRIMPAPVPGTAETVRTVIISVVVLQVISPVIRILADSDDGASELLVVSYHCRHILRNGHSVLLVTEKIYGRLFGLLRKCLCLSLGLGFFSLCPECRSIAVYAVLELLAVVRSGKPGDSSTRREYEGCRNK